MNILCAKHAFQNRVDKLGFFIISNNHQLKGKTYRTNFKNIRLVNFKIKNI